MTETAEPRVFQVRNDIGVVCQRIAPADIPEHNHTVWQIAILGAFASTRASWHTATGQQLSKHLLGEQSVVIPAGMPHAAHWQLEAELLCFFLTPTFAIQVAHESLTTDEIELTEQYGITDPLIQHLGLALKTEWMQFNTLSNLYLESIATVIAVHLIRNYSTQPPKSQPSRGGLSKPKLLQVLEYIQEHLGQELTLTQLAAVVHLSPHYFARSFKQAMGMSPHQYILNSRIERAKFLLSKQHLSITAICNDLGFQSQSHFTEVFRKQIGITPGRYRKKL